jgi:hypothetical protein
MTDLIMPPGLTREKIYREDVNAELAQLRGTQSLTPPVTYAVKPVVAGMVGWWSVIFTASTGGGYVDTWQAYIPRLTHESLRCYLALTTTATGSGEVRMSVTGSAGTLVTDSYVLGPNISSSYIFNLLHNMPVWDTTDVFVTIQSHITAGNFYVYQPYGGGIVQREPYQATLNGIS